LRLERLPSAIERFRSLGYADNVIVKGMKSTNCHVGDAGHVMEYLRSQNTKKKTLPENEPGVWTERDDEKLKFVDSVDSIEDDELGDDWDGGGIVGDEQEREMRRRKRQRMRKRDRDRQLGELVAKHGAQGVEDRREFLRRWDNA